MGMPTAEVNIIIIILTKLSIRELLSLIYDQKFSDCHVIQSVDSVSQFCCRFIHTIDCSCQDYLTLKFVYITSSN